MLLKSSVNSDKIKTIGIEELLSIFRKFKNKSRKFWFNSELILTSSKIRQQHRFTSVNAESFIANFIAREYNSGSDTTIYSFRIKKGECI